MPDDQRRFARRPAPAIMEITSKPVLRVPINLVELTRESDPNDPKMKIIVKKEDCMLNSENIRVSTHMHPLARYPLYEGGSADADWCVKHCLATTIKQTTNKSKGFFREVMRMIRIFRNKFIWVDVRAQASAIFTAEGSRELDDVDQALCYTLGQGRLDNIKLNNPSGLALPVEARETA